MPLFPGADAVVYLAWAIQPSRDADKLRAVNVDESWPTDGIQSSFYSRHKAEVERLLDRFEREHPQVRTVRLRPGLRKTGGDALLELLRGMRN